MLLSPEVTKRINSRVDMWLDELDKSYKEPLHKSKRYYSKAPSVRVIAGGKRAGHV